LKIENYFSIFASLFENNQIMEDKRLKLPTGIQTFETLRTEGLQHITVSQQAFINRQFFNLTLFALIFGVMFYDIINSLGFSYVDEICALLLLFLYGYKVFQSSSWQFNKTFLLLICIFIFYLIYSIIISSNTKGAIVMDFIIQIKPYLSFFCVYALRPVWTDNQKRILRQVIVLCSIYVLIIGTVGLVNRDIVIYTFAHVSRIATASSILAMLYLYCSDYTKTDKYVFILLLAIGMLSTRSKHFGFFIICTLLVLYLNQSFKMKLNLKNLFFVTVVLGLTLLVSWSKIEYYFISGGFGTGRAADEMYARMALYYFSIPVLMDFFPFGSGFASYATYASSVSYSSIYEKYGLSNMYGLTKAHPSFMSDTYYPALTQFGFAGIILFFYFWIYLLKRAIKIYMQGFYKEAAMAMMIIFFFLIECTSDSTITHNRGMFMMMLLGLSFSDAKNKQANENTVSQ